METDRQIDKKINRQLDTQVDKQLDRQIDIDRFICIDRQIYTYRERDCNGNTKRCSTHSRHPTHTHTRECSVWMSKGPAVSQGNKVTSLRHASILQALLLFLFPFLFSLSLLIFSLFSSYSSFKPLICFLLLAPMPSLSPFQILLFLSLGDPVSSLPPPSNQLI